MTTQPDDDEYPSHVDPKDVADVFARAEQKAAEVQALHAQAAQYAGYMRESIHVLAPLYIQMAEHGEEIQDLWQVAASGVRFIDTIHDQLDEATQLVTPLTLSLQTSASSLRAFNSTTDTMVTTLNAWDVKFVPPEDPPFFAVGQPQYEEKLFKIDPALANTYREIRQVYYGTTADPKRAAIMLMRQTFDHFFGELAPDDEVRASPFWEQKPGLKPNQVTRRQRITYAAHIHIKNKARANTIIESSDNILHVYDMLNRLHKRGTLSEEQARSALRTMQKFIESWVDAITD